MKTTDGLQAVLPANCRKIARMLGIDGKAYLSAAEAVNSHETLKEWLEPLCVVMSAMETKLSLRTNADLSHPEKLEAFSLVLLGKGGHELFRIEVCPQDFILICPGLYLPQTDLYATRFQANALADHLIQKKVPLELFLRALSRFGEPAGTRGKGVWLDAQKVVGDVMDETCPDSLILKENMAGFNRFINEAFGGLANALGEVEFLSRSLYGPRGFERTKSCGVIFSDDMLMIEITEGSMIIEFNFACLAPTEEQRFDPAQLYRAIRQARDPSFYVSRLFSSMRALRHLTGREPQAEKMRQRILMMISTQSEKTVVPLAQASA